MVSNIPWFVWFVIGVIVGALLTRRACDDVSRGNVNVKPPPTTPRPKGAPGAQGGSGC